MLCKLISSLEKAFQTIAILFIRLICRIPLTICYNYVTINLRGDLFDSRQSKSTSQSKEEYLLLIRLITLVPTGVLLYYLSNIILFRV